jgi:hypothetical protein
MAKPSSLKITVASSIFLTFFAIASLSYVVFNFYFTGLVIFNNLLNLSLYLTLGLLNVLVLVLSMFTLTPKTANETSFRRLRTLSNLIILVVVASLAIVSYQITAITPDDPTKNLGFLIFVNVLSLIGPLELFVEVEVLKINLTDTGVLAVKNR